MQEGLVLTRSGYRRVVARAPLALVLRRFADWFDYQREDNSKFIENAMKQTYEDDASVGNFLLLVGLSIPWLLNNVAGRVSSGYIDTLRIGEGVEQGGWGYGRDALRASILLGPLVRMLRLGAGGMTTLVEAQTAPNCTWVSATRGTLLSGNRYVVTVGDFLETVGLPRTYPTGPDYINDVLWHLKASGVEVDMAVGAQLQTMEDVVTVARENSDGVLVFSFKFVNKAGQPGAHAIVAAAYPGIPGLRGLQAVRFYETNGQVFNSLEELLTYELSRGRYAITPKGTGGVIHDAIGMRMFGVAPALVNSIGLEVSPVDAGSIFGPSLGQPQVAGIPQAHGFLTVETETMLPGMQGEITVGPRTWEKKTYTVGPTDDLFTIANAVYGDPKKWVIIYQANKDHIGPGTMVHPGQLLWIP
jgi:hypothetical protein